MNILASKLVCRYTSISQKSLIPISYIIVDIWCINTDYTCGYDDITGCDILTHIKTLI